MPQASPPAPKGTLLVLAALLAGLALVVAAARAYAPSTGLLATDAGHAARVAETPVAATGAAAMVSVPEGAFTMGCGAGPGNCMTGGLDQPAHSVWVSAFAIDRTEVTRRAYEECVTAGACVGGTAASSPGAAPFR